ncbi:MAG: hypothetical protein NC408_04520 [Candidatus Gastranaerophilales bacterium]|nr:hypothetical protein [Candidatus Gastranaerophilales bacterium]MCM1072264.1 hypothetical protein [Bacteroides sp.]
MAFLMDENCNITMIQGDSGQIVVNNLPVDKDYIVYFAIQDSERNPIGEEVSVEARRKSSVTIELVGALTDLLVVPEESKKTTYYYGIKICSLEKNTEETLVLGNGGIGTVNTMTVYPRKVRGIE